HPAPPDGHVRRDEHGRRPVRQDAPAGHQWGGVRRHRQQRKRGRRAAGRRGGGLPGQQQQRPPGPRPADRRHPRPRRLRLRLPAGTHGVRVDMSTVGHITPAEAYVVPAGTPGTETGANAGNTTYGMAFTTDRPVVITSLGVFDDNGDGLTTTLTAVLYDDATKFELARITFTPQNPGTLVGGTRYLDLPNPIILPAGVQGMIVAHGFGAAADRAGRNPNSFDPSSTVWTTDGGAGRLSFTGGFRAFTPNTFPTIPDRIELGRPPFPLVFGLPNPYAAGSFMYRDVPWA